MSLITSTQLNKVCPNISAARAQHIADIINDVCPKYGINTADILHEFLATIAHESGEFTIKSENMFYSTPQRIVDVWPSRFNLTGEGGKLNAKLYIKNPEKLANTVYANRMENGDTASGDGYRFRGGGFIQLTGRESYRRYAAYKNITIEDAAVKIKTDDSWALDCGCWEFVIDKKLIQASVDDDFRKVTKFINGGYIGWEDRSKYYERAKKYIV